MNTVANILFFVTSDPMGNLERVCCPHVPVVKCKWCHKNKTSPEGRLYCIPLTMLNSKSLSPKSALHLKEIETISYVDMIYI